MNLKKQKIALIFKTVASLCFIVLGVKAYLINNSKILLLFVIGMLFDGLGDVLLGIRNIAFKEKMFLFGTYSFMIGHIFYLAALIYKDWSNIALILLIAAILTCIYFYFTYHHCKLKKIQYFILPIYALMIYGIMVFGIYNYLNVSSTNNLAFMIGAIMFACSDTVLSFYNFGNRKGWMHPVYSFLYYVGQLLIALSLF
ncbi:MAG: lysoplasmalogenase [Erysipelotrichaceae bacterium]|nr:lysoplasmalogenase [Erysipelotrichaceae bacterium]